MSEKNHARVDQQLIEIIVELYAFFNDYEKIYFWLYTKNLNLGGSQPIALIKRGRGNKVLEFIKSSHEGE